MSPGQRRMDEPKTWKKGVKLTSKQEARDRLLGMREKLLDVFKLKDKEQRTLNEPKWTISSSKRDQFQKMVDAKNNLFSRLKFHEATITTLLNKVETGEDPIEHLRSIREEMVAVRSVADEAQDVITSAFVKATGDMVSEMYMKHISGGGNPDGYTESDGLMLVKKAWERKAGELSSPAQRILTYLDKENFEKKINQILKDMGEY